MERTSVWILREVVIEWQDCEGSIPGGLGSRQGSSRRGSWRGPGISCRGWNMPARECRFPPKAKGSWGKILRTVGKRPLSLQDGEYLEGSDIGGCNPCGSTYTRAGERRPGWRGRKAGRESGASRLKDEHIPLPLLFSEKKHAQEASLPGSSLDVPPHNECICVFV